MEALAMVIQEKKLSNKINYKVLDNLKATHTSSFSITGGSLDNAGAAFNTSTSSKSTLKAEPVLNRYVVAALYVSPIVSRWVMCGYFCQLSLNLVCKWSKTHKRLKERF